MSTPLCNVRWVAFRHAGAGELRTEQAGTVCRNAAIPELPLLCEALEVLLEEWHKANRQRRLGRRSRPDGERAALAIQRMLDHCDSCKSCSRLEMELWVLED